MVLVDIGRAVTNQDPLVLGRNTVIPPILLHTGITFIIEDFLLVFVPFFLGAALFNERESLRDLMKTFVLGGLAYLPLVVLELKLCPQLHAWVYGYHQHSFGQQKRFGGYRPMVFMQHGLACAMWMTTASIVGLWLWMSGAVKKIYHVPMYVLVPAMIVTAGLWKAAGAFLLLFLGLGTFFWIRNVRTALPLLALIAFIPTYVALRSSAMWSGQNLVDAATTIFNEKRAASLQVRLDAENLLTEKALKQPSFGYGRWNRNRVYDEKGKDIAVTDGLWVIVLGQTGFVGLTAITTAILMPALLYWRRVPPRWWMHPMAAAGASFAVLLPLHMVDNLWNAMLNPIYVLVIGGLVALGAGSRRAVTQAQPQGFAAVPQPMVPRPALAGAR